MNIIKNLMLHENICNHDILNLSHTHTQTHLDIYVM